MGRTPKAPGTLAWTRARLQKWSSTTLREASPSSASLRGGTPTKRKSPRGKPLLRIRSCSLLGDGPSLWRRDLLRQYGLLRGYRRPYGLLRQNRLLLRYEFLLGRDLLLGHERLLLRRLLLLGFRRGLLLRSRCFGPRRNLRKLGLDNDPVYIVGEGAGLKRDDVLARNRLRHAPIGGLRNEAVKDLVGVLGTVGVGQEHLVALLKLIQVVEHKEAVRARKAHAVPGDVHVGLLLPRGVVDVQVLNPRHLGDGELHRRVLVGRVGELLFALVRGAGESPQQCRVLAQKCVPHEAQASEHDEHGEHGGSPSRPSLLPIPPVPTRQPPRPVYLHGSPFFRPGTPEVNTKATNLYVIYTLKVTYRLQ